MMRNDMKKCLDDEMMRSPMNRRDGLMQRKHPEQDGTNRKANMRQNSKTKKTSTIELGSPMMKFIMRKTRNHKDVKQDKIMRQEWPKKFEIMTDLRRDLWTIRKE